MKLSKFTVIIAVLLMAILAIGAVSAESIGDADASLTSDSDLTLQSSDDSAKDVSAVDTVSTDKAVENDMGDTVLGEGDDTDPDDEGDDTDPDPTDENVYKINDETYSTYFNDNGTPTDALSADGNYQLEIGFLNGKNITINSGSNINITSKVSDDDEHIYEGCIDGGTITIGDGAGSAGSIIISNLYIDTLNGAGINILDLTNKVTIDNC